MKIFQKILVLPVVAILLAACNSNDDGFYNETYVEAQNLVNIEVAPQYQVDDVLFVNARIPKLLQQTNETTLLDVRKSTGNADSFMFNFMLEKEGADGEFTEVDLAGNYVADQGDAVVGSLIQGIVEYNAGDEEYIFRGGIRLTQTGNYRLSFSNNQDALQKIELRSTSTGNNNDLRMNIATTANNISESGTYNFTVN